MNNQYSYSFHKSSEIKYVRFYFLNDIVKSSLDNDKLPQETIDILNNPTNILSEWNIDTDNNEEDWIEYSGDNTEILHSYRTKDDVDAIPLSYWNSVAFISIEGEILSVIVYKVTTNEIDTSEAERITLTYSTNNSIKEDIIITVDTLDDTYIHKYNSKSNDRYHEVNVIDIAFSDDSAETYSYQFNPNPISIISDDISKYANDHYKYRFDGSDTSDYTQDSLITFDYQLGPFLINSDKIISLADNSFSLTFIPMQKIYSSYKGFQYILGLSTDNKLTLLEYNRTANGIESYTISSSIPYETLVNFDIIIPETSDLTGILLLKNKETGLWYYCKYTNIASILSLGEYNIIYDSRIKVQSESQQVLGLDRLASDIQEYVYSRSSYNHYDTQEDVTSTAPKLYSRLYLNAILNIEYVLKYHCYNESDFDTEYTPKIYSEFTSIDIKEDNIWNTYILSNSASIRSDNIIKIIGTDQSSIVKSISNSIVNLTDGSRIDILGKINNVESREDVLILKYGSGFESRSLT